MLDNTLGFTTISSISTWGNNFYKSDKNQISVTVFYTNTIRMELYFTWKHKSRQASYHSTQQRLASKQHACLDDCCLYKSLGSIVLSDYCTYMYLDCCLLPYYPVSIPFIEHTIPKAKRLGNLGLYVAILWKTIKLRVWSDVYKSV